MADMRHSDNRVPIKGCVPLSTFEANLFQWHCVDWNIRTSVELICLTARHAHNERKCTSTR